MNILLINHYAGSLRHGMEYRPYYLAREWVRLGHRVRIVASSQSHIRANAPEMDGAARFDETIDGIDYTWYATPPYAGNGVRRVRNMASFIGALYADARRLVHSVDPDVVIASSTCTRFRSRWPRRSSPFATSSSRWRKRRGCSFAPSRPTPTSGSATRPASTECS